MSTWNVLFLELWRREQHTLQFKWDTLAHGRQHEAIRPEFEKRATQRRQNAVTGDREPHIPRIDKCKRYSLSIAATAFWVCLVLAAVLATIVYQMSVRVVLANANSEALRKHSVTLVQTSAAILNLIAILLLGYCYSYVAVKLTDMEVCC